MIETDEALLDLLNEIGFPQRYYALVDRQAGKQSKKPLDLRPALAATGRAFKNNKKEKFYGSTERVDGVEFVLNFANSYGAVEAIFAIKRDGMPVLGDTFASMALYAAEEADADFDRDPPYPNVEVGTAADLKKVVAELVELYESVRIAYLAAA